MNFYKNKLEIERLPVSKMLKLEIAELAEEVISVVQKNDPELLLIKPVFDLLVAQKSLISKLKVPYGVDPYLLELKPAREEMLLLASKINLKVRLASKRMDPKEMHVIQTSTKRHLRYLNRSRNRTEVNQKIAGFLDDVENDENLQAAITQLDLLEDVMTLGKALDDVREIISNRSAKLSTRTKISTRELKRVVYGLIEDVFKEIEVAQLRNPDIDYKPVVNELNVVSRKYRLQITLRDHSNKRKAAIKNGDTTDDENGDEATQPEGTAGNDTSTEVETTAMNGNGAHHPSQVYDGSIMKMESPSSRTSAIESSNGSLESVDQEKATSDDNVNDEAAHSKQ